MTLWQSTPPLTTRGGKPARIYAVDGAEPYPIHGAIYEEDDGWQESSWTFDGQQHIGIMCDDCIDTSQPGAIQSNLPTDQTQIGGDHYTRKSIQPWAAMQAWLSPEQFKGYLRGCALKYLARCDDKGGIEDLRKAQHYLAKLIETLGAP